MRAARQGKALASFVLAAAVTATGACGGSDERSANPQSPARPDLRRALGELTQERASAAVALVQKNAATWRGASGSTSNNRRASPKDRFGIASTTKTFVASVVLQLVDEGRLSLDHSVERWLPGRVRDGRRITIRQLLSHTSGLPEGLALPARDSQPPLVSPPGKIHSYANTNYVLLGLIAEKMTGRRLNELVRDRIFRPLRLQQTSYGTAALSNASARPAWLGAPEQPTDDASGAGGVVSTVDDLARFFRALFGGKLLGANVMAEMTRSVDAGPGLRAGLGIFRLELPCGSAWGHGGDEPSYSNQVLASRDGSTVVVVAQNTSGWPAARATAESLYCSTDRMESAGDRP